MVHNMLVCAGLISRVDTWSVGSFYGGVAGVCTGLWFGWLVYIQPATVNMKPSWGDIYIHDMKQPTLADLRTNYSSPRQTRW